MKEITVDADFMRRIKKHGPYQVKAHTIGPMSIIGEGKVRFPKTLATSIEALLNQIWRDQ